MTLRRAREDSAKPGEHSHDQWMASADRRRSRHGVVMAIATEDWLTAADPIAKRANK